METETKKEETTMGDGLDTRGTIFDTHTGTGVQIGEIGGYGVPTPQDTEEPDPGDTEESNGIEPSGREDWSEEEP